MARNLNFRIGGSGGSANGTGNDDGAGKSSDPLAVKANTKHIAYQQAVHKSMTLAWEIGAILIQAKKGCVHGEWEDWIKEHLCFSKRHAQKYMAWARSWDGKSVIHDAFEEKWHNIMCGESPEPESSNGNSVGNANPTSVTNQTRRLRRSRKGRSTSQNGSSRHKPSSSQSSSPKPSPDDSPDPTTNRGDAYEPPKDSDLKDGRGEAVPDHLRDAFADFELPTILSRLEEIREEVLSLKAAAKRLEDHYPLLRVGDFWTHADAAAHEILLARSSMSCAVPYAPCPRCEGACKVGGKNCTGCIGGGHVPEWRYGELAAEKGAKE